MTANRTSGFEDLLKFLAMMQTVSGMAGGAESTIATQESVRDRPRVTRETAGNLLLAGAGIVAGLVLHAWGWLYRVGASGGEGALLSVTGFGLLLYLVLVGVLALVIKQRWGVNLLSGYLSTLAATWVLTCGLLVVVAPVEHEFGIVMAIGGLVLGLVSMPFFYNQWKDLIDPYWRQSPYERAIQTSLFPVISGMSLSGNRDSGPVNERVIFVNANGMRVADDTEPQEKPTPQFARFVAGLGEFGTSLRAWEREIGRDTYQQYRDALIRLRWARWKSVNELGEPNETQGWELTEDVGWILERIG